MIRNGKQSLGLHFNPFMLVVFSALIMYYYCIVVVIIIANSLKEYSSGFMVSLLPLPSPSNLFLSPCTWSHVLTVSGIRSTNDDKVVQYCVSFLSKHLLVGRKKPNRELE